MKKKINKIAALLSAAVIVLCLCVLPAFADNSTYSNYLEFTFDDDTVEIMGDFTIVFDSSITLEHYWDDVLSSSALRITDGTSSRTYYPTSSQPYQVRLIICFNEITSGQGDITIIEDEGGVFYTGVVGYNSGITVSYTSGYDAGYDVGYSVGEIAGDSAGYDRGYSDGYSGGYAIGYEEGFYSGSNINGSWYELVFAVVEAPLNAFQSLFGFEIFGVNIAGFLISLMVVMLVIAIVKKFL